MFCGRQETRANEERNPDGLTYFEFLGKYKDFPKIAALCWRLGIQPEEFKEELQKLMSD